MAVTFIDEGPNSLAGRTGSRVLAWLIAVNLFVSLAIWLGLLFSRGRLDLGSLLCLPGSWAGFCRQPWGLLTYMVTQVGLLHLLFNLIWLYFFGRLALMMMEGRQIGFLYVGGGLVGGLLFIVWSSVRVLSAPLLGSSASVMAMMACAAVYRPKFRVNLWLFGRVSITAIAVVSIILTFLGAGGGNEGGQAAHVGGLLFGVVTGLMMKRGTDPSRSFSKLAGSFGRLQAERRSAKAAKRRRADEALLTGIRGRLADRERLDELLDKIRASGYSSLTRSERAELNALSNRLDSPRGDDDI